MTNPWNKGTSRPWSDQMDEEELRKSGSLADTVPEESEMFPTLGEAVKMKPKPKKKLEKKKMTLAELMSEGPAPSATYSIKNKSESEIRMCLPTQPGEKPAGDLGRSRYQGQGMRNSGFNRDDRGPRREREEDMGPSRADESSNWGMNKSSGLSSGYSDRGSGGGGGYDRQRSGYDMRRNRYDDGPRPADGDWSRDGKSSFGSRSGFGGFNEDRRSTGYGFNSGGSRSTYISERSGTEDRWSQRPSPNADGADAQMQRKPLDLKRRTKPLPDAGITPEVAEATTKSSNLFGLARPREEVLKERGVDINSMSQDRFSSRSDIASERDHASQPESPASSIRESEHFGIEAREPSYHHSKSKPKSDPFAGARPREEVLSQR